MVRMSALLLAHLPTLLAASVRLPRRDPGRELDKKPLIPELVLLWCTIGESFESGRGVVGREALRGAGEDEESDSSCDLARGGRSTRWVNPTGAWGAQPSGVLWRWSNLPEASRGMKGGVALFGILGSALFKSGAPPRLVRAEDCGWVFVVLAEGLVRSPSTGLRAGTDDLDTAGYGLFCCWVLPEPTGLRGIVLMFWLDELICGTAPFLMP